MVGAVFSFKKIGLKRELGSLGLVDGGRKKWYHEGVMEVIINEGEKAILAGSEEGYVGGFFGWS